MFQATLRSKTETVSKKIIFTFPYTNAYLTKFDLGVKYIKVNPGNNLKNLGSTCIDNATYQFSRSSVYWFWRRRFFKVFTIYGQRGHVGQVTQLIYINFHSHFPISFHMSFGSKSLNYFCQKQVLTLKSE